MGKNGRNLAMTPLHVEIAMYFCGHQTSETVPWVGQDIDAVAKVFREFTEFGLLELSDEGSLWKATDALHQYVDELRRVPLPVRQAKKSTHTETPNGSLLNKVKKRIGECSMKTKRVIMGGDATDLPLPSPRTKT